jgi:phospholipid/cholesterol/gamma-HCH transport system ATP-binding protein
VLYQSSALFGSMTVLENVMLPIEEHTRMPRGLRTALATVKIQAVGLQGFEHYLPDQLSGGMKKRAGLARALALDPPILFLDEPSAGLDPISAADFDRLILSLRHRFGTSLVIVTHELDSIFAVADRTIVLKDKRVAADGPVRETIRTADDAWIRDFFTRAGTKELSDP